MHFGNLGLTVLWGTQDIIKWISITNVNDMTKSSVVLNLVTCNTGWGGGYVVKRGGFRNRVNINIVTKLFESEEISA